MERSSHLDISEANITGELCPAHKCSPLKSYVRDCRTERFLPTSFRMHLQVYSSCLGKEIEQYTTSQLYISRFGIYLF